MRINNIYRIVITFRSKINFHTNTNICEPLVASLFQIRNHKIGMHIL